MPENPSANIWTKKDKPLWITIWRNEYALAAITTILIIGLVAIYLENSCLILKYIYTSFVAIWAICLIINGYKKAKSNNSFLAILDCAILLLLGALIALVVGVISKTIDIQSEETSAFTIMSFTLALAGLIPYLISRTIAKSEIDKIVDEKVGALFNQKIKELEDRNNTSLYNLTKQSGHSARIIAKFLKDSPKKEEHPWAIGWASQSLIRYMQINYTPESRFYTDCLNIIVFCIKERDTEMVNEPTADNGLDSNNDSIKEQKQRTNKGDDTKEAISQIAPEEPNSEDKSREEQEQRTNIDLLDMFLLYHYSAKGNFLKQDHDAYDMIRRCVEVYCTGLELEELFDRSKFYEYIQHPELDQSKKMEHFSKLLAKNKLKPKKSNE